MVAILPRSAWGARWPIPGGRHVPLSARRWFVVHWPGGTAIADPAQNLRNIEAFHVQTQRWFGIGYNFAVSRDGRIWEGCGRDTRGVHEATRNTDGIGVVLLVSVGELAPWPALDATRALYEQVSNQAGRRLTMSTHNAHFATQCPGANITQWVRAGMPSAGFAGPSSPGPAPAPPAGGAPPFGGVLLRQGSRGPAVAQYQARMIQRGWRALTSAGGADGIFGPVTDRVTRQFQAERPAEVGPVDGIVGPRTWAAAFRTDNII